MRIPAAIHLIPGRAAVSVTDEQGIAARAGFFEDYHARLIRLLEQALPAVSTGWQYQESAPEPLTEALNAYFAGEPPGLGSDQTGNRQYRFFSVRYGPGFERISGRGDAQLRSNWRSPLAGQAQPGCRPGQWLESGSPWLVPCHRVIGG